MAKDLHHLVKGQLSSHINESFPHFVEFLKGYYEWLETEGSPFYDLKNHLSHLDFERSVESYVDMLKREYLENVPERILADKEKMIKFSKHFFGSLGTEKSFEFLFRILYDDDVEIYYPRDDILRGSDGNWVSNERLIYVTDSGNVDDFLYKRIEQTIEVYPGVFENSYATVNRIVKRNANGFVFAELYVSDTVGKLSLDHPIGVGQERVEWILPIAGNVEVISPGSRYVQDNVLTYSGDATFSIDIIASSPRSVDSRYTTTLDESAISVMIDGTTVADFSYDGKWIYHDAISPGSEVTVTFPIYKGFAAVSETDIDGGITEVNVVDPMFGIVHPQELMALEGGTGASLLVHPAVARDIPGYYLDESGFLSDRKRLQDNDYYQDFSYVIKTSNSIDQYRDVVLNLLHPSGFKMFGEVNIIELIRLMIRDCYLDFTFKSRDIIFVETINHLYNRTGFVDDWKCKFGSKTYKTGNFANLVVGDVINRPNNRLNIHDSSITIHLGEYVVDGYMEEPHEYVTNILTEYQYGQ